MYVFFKRVTNVSCSFFSICSYTLEGPPSFTDGQTDAISKDGERRKFMVQLEYMIWL